MEPEALREYVSENRELEKQLTKRNQQYIFDLKKSLDAANLSEEEKTVALHEILPVLVQEQKGGRTARQLFGTVSERTEAILTKPEAATGESKPVLMWLDNTLLVLGIFALMTGVMGLFVQESTQVYGLITLLLMSMIGGWVFYLMYKYIYKYEQPGADKSQRPKIWKVMLILTGSFLVWISVIALSSLLPPVINIILDPVILVALGAASLGGRYYLKKRYNIVGSLSAPRR